MPDPFTIPIGDVHPSQCYLNGEKLARAADWFDFDDPNYDPLPVRRFEDGPDRWTLTDGHTRAFLASLAGDDELRVVEDTDDLPTDLYVACIGWCVEDGVTEVGDLAGRVVGPETFEERWIERCKRKAAALEDDSSA